MLSRGPRTRAAGAAELVDRATGPARRTRRRVFTDRGGRETSERLTPELIQDLYRRHAYALFRRCQHLLRDPDEARDAMQESFLKLLEDPARFRGHSSHATFLFGVATNVCLNRLRNRAARGASWQAALARALEGGHASAADVAEARDLAAAILAEADEATAAIAVFHFIDGLPQGEIAALVGRSRVTVNHVLRRFRECARRRAEAP